MHEEALHELGIEESIDEISAFEASGCVACNDTGYRGRVGLYEVMNISPRLREQIVERATVVELKRQAMEEGMMTLRMDGLWKFKQGHTSLEEVLRETASDTSK